MLERKLSIVKDLQIKSNKLPFLHIAPVAIEQDNSGHANFIDNMLHSFPHDQDLGEEFRFTT